METFKKRQKAWARKEKQQKKAARRMERRNEKTRPADTGEEADPTISDSAKSEVQIESEHGAQALASRQS